MTRGSFGTHDTRVVDQSICHILRFDRIKTAHRLPYSLKVLLENLLRSADGRVVTAEQIQALTHWQPHATKPRETP